MTRLRSKTPRYDLAKAQAASTIYIGVGCVRRANEVLYLNQTEARAFIHKLFGSLTALDFAHTEMMRPAVGKPLYGDVYGKETEEAIWFIKIEFDGSTTTVVMSCHEAEHPILLANGTKLSRADHEPQI